MLDLSRSQIRSLKETLVRYFWLMVLVRVDQYFDQDYYLSLLFVLSYGSYFMGQNRLDKEFHCYMNINSKHIHRYMNINSKHIHRYMDMLGMNYQLICISYLSLILYTLIKGLIFLGLGTYIPIVIELPNLFYL
jgi:hypothetical protein